MTKISRYILVLIAVMVSSIVLPELYWMAVEKPDRIPYIHYSCMIDDFTFKDMTNEHYSDSKGNSYTQGEYEALLPLLFSRQLMIDKNLPDTIRGVAFDMHIFAKARCHSRIRPVDINQPQPKLFPLYESESGRINLTQPEDVFRINWRMEFINAESNTIDEEKSRMYSAALYHKGFQFPAKIIAGIPTTRKTCDEGYLIVDDKDQLFHLKMIKSKPYIKKVDLPQGLELKHITCVDFKDKLYYAYLIAQDNGIYILTQDDYELEKIPITDYDTDTKTIQFKGDYFHYNISLQHEGVHKTYALNKDFEIVDTHTWIWPTREETTEGKVSASIFPFELSIKDENTRFVCLYPEKPRGLIWMIINLGFVMIQLLLIRKRGLNIKNQILDIIVVAITGVFGFIAVNAFPNKW